MKMSNTNSSVRNDVKQLANQIENLAREVQLKVDQGGDVISVANELVRNSSTFVFTLGEMYALERSKKVKTVTVSNASRHYHNVRDSLGRFVKV